MISRVGLNRINNIQYSQKKTQLTVPFSALKNTSQNVTDSIVKTNVQAPEPKSSKLPETLIITTGIAIAAIGFACFNKRSISKFFKNLELKKITQKLEQNFPEDTLYRSRLASHIGLSDKELYKLSSIGGSQELKSVVTEFMQTPEVYSPRIIKAAEGGANEIVDNAITGVFGANFHNHTILSDGTMSVREFLQKSAEYANKRFAKVKKPFYVAITDHDTVESCKEAVKIISEDPHQYRNLRLFLGTEHTVLYKSPKFLSQDGQIHVLSYGINPFSPQFKTLLADRVEANQRNIKNAIAFVNSKMQPVLSKFGFEYDFDDMSKIAPAMKTGLKNSTYYMKDYLQFRLIHAKTLTSNPELQSILQSLDVNPSDIDFAKPIALIPKKLDYSKGQKYYEYYYEALKQQVINSAKERNFFANIESITKHFPPLDDSFKAILDNIEGMAMDSKSKAYVPPCEYLDFESCITKLANLEDGIIGIAHPGVIFPDNAVKNTKDLPSLYDELYSKFKQFGKKKALFAEDFYQSYYPTTDFSVIDKLKQISSSHGLLKTGGTDTHGTNIFAL